MKFKFGFPQFLNIILKITMLHLAKGLIMKRWTRACWGEPLDSELKWTKCTYLVNREAHLVVKQESQAVDERGEFSEPTSIVMSG